MLYRFANGHFLLFILGLLVVVGIVLLIVYLTNRKYKAPANQVSGTAANAATATAAAATNPTQDRLLSILGDQKASGGMGAAEYEERRMVLEGARADNHANADVVLLKERYARGELTTAAFVEARNKLLGIG